MSSAHGAIASSVAVGPRMAATADLAASLTQAVLAKETLIGDEIEDVVKKAGPVGPTN